MTIETQPLRGPLRKRLSHLWAREVNDWYVEPEWCSEHLFAMETFAGSVWDPAAGVGRIYHSAQRAGLQAWASDLHLRGLNRYAGRPEIGWCRKITTPKYPW